MAVVVDTLNARPRHPEKAHRPDAPLLRKPDWIRVKAPVSRGYSETQKIVRENIARETRLHTDESKLYFKVGAEFASHETVNHSAKEYARGDVTTNSAEGYFSIFKRGIYGCYFHVSETHLHRYAAEFDFRFNNRIEMNDADRFNALVTQIVGKRLTYAELTAKEEKISEPEA